MLNLIFKTFDLMKHRARPLPRCLVQTYVKGILKKQTALLDSAGKFGTPQYFFDEPALSQRLEQFKATVSRYFDSSRIYYAVKSNPYHGILRKVLDNGMGLDVSSGAELSLALSLHAGEIIFSGPGKTFEELSLAVDHHDRVMLLVDSFGELRRLSLVIRQKELSRNAVRIGVRVRSAGQGIWNRFGIPVNDLKAFLEKASALGHIQVYGLQFHTSWNLNPEAQIRMLDEINRYVKTRLPAGLTSSLRFLDIGGGYWPEQGEWLNSRNTVCGQLTQVLDPGYRFDTRHYYRQATPLDSFMKHLSDHLNRLGPPMSAMEIRMEPGRWIATPAMHILLRVVDKKDYRNVVTDGGTGMLGWERPMSEYIPVINLTRPYLNEIPLHISGSLCTPLDMWGWSIFGKSAEPGDILVVPDQGAYTYTLRQAFIKPLSKVIRYDGKTTEETG
ncbi:MAG: alanine racemase [Desulfobacterales bacterium]|nr:alanine racemase [Desulfobacterales bacterium]MDD4073713.1 alanine racemase [Desulfobacterales bacterium]MDD4393469.1 alanine racemase [Desulfobacterales bacterium]